MSSFDPRRHLLLLYRYSAELADMIRAECITPDSLRCSVMQQRAVVKSLELIGEQAWLLDKAGERIPGVELHLLGGMRHRLVHNYEGINWNVVEDAAFVDNEELLVLLESEVGMLGENLAEGTQGDLGDGDIGI